MKRDTNIVDDAKAKTKINLKKIDVETLRALTETMPYQDESAGDFVRRMRDEDRY